MYYIGHTKDLNDRIKRHNTDRSKFTRRKGPWELVIVHKLNSKKEAYQLELKLKKMKSSIKAIDFLKRLVAEHSDS